MECRRTDRMLRSAGVLLALFLWGYGAESAAQPIPRDSAKATDERNEHLASRGFYHRRAKGIGWFATRDEPVIANRRTLRDVLRGVPGVNVQGRQVFTNRRSGACPLAVFVDGSYTTIRIVDELALEDIEAIEVYRGPAEVPIEFAAPPFERTCGALVVWSRIGPDD